MGQQSPDRLFGVFPPTTFNLVDNIRVVHARLFGQLAHLAHFAVLTELREQFTKGNPGGLFRRNRNRSSTLH
ncbi:MAG: hypothetical protein RL292_386 [Candidatus Parcubacteria bacterium]